MLQDKKYWSARKIHKTFGLSKKESKDLLVRLASASYANGWRASKMLEEIEKIIDPTYQMFGVEVIYEKDNWTPAYYYLNAGDTYKATILCDLNTGKFIISSWGDVVEFQMKRFGYE